MLHMQHELGHKKCGSKFRDTFSVEPEGSWIHYHFEPFGVKVLELGTPQKVVNFTFDFKRSSLSKGD